MSLTAALVFFLLMFLLAALPSASVALVVGRSTTLGFRSGAAVAGGIVTGDLVFMALALSGMTALAETMGSLFGIIRCLAGICLVWLGIGLFRSAGPTSSAAPSHHSPTNSLAASYLAGLALTLGDVKAILFYASLFPALVDPARLQASDVVLITAITIVTVGGVKLLYARTAHGIASRFSTPAIRKWIRKGAGALMIGTGTYMLAKS